MKLPSRLAAMGFAALVILLCAIGAWAGPDDEWVIQLRSFYPDGRRGLAACKFGTGSPYCQLLTEGPAVPEVYCYDLGGTSPLWCWDVRSPMSEGETQTWHLIVTATTGYTASQIVLKGWNPTGVTSDLDGSIAVKLVMIDDPSWPADGSFAAGATLWTVDPTANSSSSSPAFTASLNWTGQPIRIDLVAGTGDPTPISIGEAKLLPSGAAVCFTDVVVTSAASSDSNAPGVWLQSPDGAAAAKIDDSWTVSPGDRIDCTGSITWQDGLPILLSPQLKRQTTGSQAAARFMRGSDLACDRSGTLHYQGLNPVGLLAATCGEVTAVDSAARFFYINDGSGMCDGTGQPGNPHVGLRVTCPEGTDLPSVGARRRVTGIRSILKLVLTADTMVNGTPRHAGETLYVPVLAAREAGDVLPL